MESDWERLPGHLLYSVLERLMPQGDFLRLSLVCMSWHSIAYENECKCTTKLGRHSPPLLLISTGEESIWSLYDVMNDKFFDFQLRLPNKRCCGSSKGWLVFVEKDFSVTLINPFSTIEGKEKRENSIVHLPQLIEPDGFIWFERYDYYVYDAILTADPILNANECIVAVTYVERCQLAFIRLSKDTTWTYLDNKVRLVNNVVCIEDKFYVVDDWSRLYSFAVTTPQSHLEIKELAEGINRECLVQKYLVALSDKEVLMVHRFRELTDDEKYVTKKFIIFDLNFEERKWIEKKSLGDIALFLGHNSSVFVSASNHPGCQPNCIYFSYHCVRQGNDVERGKLDFGAYDVENQCILQNNYTVAKSMIQMSKQPPRWVAPTVKLN